MKRTLSLQSPPRLLVMTAGTIYAVELAIMLILPWLHSMPPAAMAALDATALVVVLFPVLYLFSFRIMARRLAEREQAEAALREARAQLERRVQERTAELEGANARLQTEVVERRQAETALEQRNREMALLAELGDLLQACTTAEEASRAISHMAPQLFPNASGGLFAYNSSRDNLEAVVTWGRLPPELGQRMLEPDKCWALRLGRPHREAGLCLGLPCQTPPRSDNLLCVPMAAQGETLGVLHLRTDQVDGASPEPAALNEPLALTSADRIALALADLRLRETLRNQSIRDPLTDLFNRRFMEETLAGELRRAERSQRPVGMIMLDLDHFKRFNDTFGHEAGDTLLRELGVFLAARVRGGDVACRFGGEEFVLILPETTPEDTHRRAEEIRERVRDLTVTHRGRALGIVTASLGVAAFPKHGTTAEALLRAADTALYRAKAEGRDRVAVADHNV